MQIVKATNDFITFRQSSWQLRTFAVGKIVGGDYYLRMSVIKTGRFPVRNF